MSPEEIKPLLKQLWVSYTALNPQVPLIHRLIAQREGTRDLSNDHIALRTFQHPKVGLAVLAKTFLQLGFEERDTYHLKDKHVFAKYYAHPSGQWPRVFISELELDSLSQAARRLIDHLIDQVPKTDSIITSGRPWTVSYADYKTLLAESEYASWMAAHGFRMNHATLSVNAMKSFKSLEALVVFLQAAGFTMNGEDTMAVIQKASDAEGELLLKQASTLAPPVTVSFTDGGYEVPGCYYEFIQRFQGYDGFDPGNATKIMESTNTRKAS